MRQSLEESLHEKMLLMDKKYPKEETKKTKNHDELFQNMTKQEAIEFEDELKFLTK
jgi:hypothetical protein